MSDRLRVLGVFPHPDDESYSCAGTLAGLADAGAEVHILAATNGAAGGDLASDGVALGGRRADELACSCKAIGALPPRFLGLVDGGLSQVDFPAVVGALVREIRAVRPQIVVGLGADGVYGHPDHIALHRLLVAALATAPGGERYPEEQFGPVWSPTRVFYAAFPRGMFRPMYEHMLRSEYRTFIRGLDPDRLGVEPADVAAAVNVAAVADRKLAAIACHRSQLRDGDPYTLFPGDLVQRTLRIELFTAGHEAPSGVARLDDLASELVW